MKRLLIFSHASVLEINRDLYYQLGAKFQAEIKIVAPTFWRGDLIRHLRCQKNTGYPEIEVIDLPVRFPGNGSLFYYRANLQEKFKDWSPDIIFVDEEPWSLACLQIFRAFPDAQRIFYTKQNLKKKLPPPFSLFQRHIFRKASYCFSVSDEVSSVLRWKGFSGKIHYLPHSFDPEKFRPLGLPLKKEIRAGIGIGADEFVVGYFGRLEPEKGIEDLLNAIRILSAAGERIHFLIVGNGSMESQVLEFCSSEQRAKVTFRPAIAHHQVGDTVGAIDLLVLPSRTVKNWKEQFGRILVEAMACGAAVVGSDSGEIPHLIARSNGGLVFREGNAEDLAEKIRRLANEKALLKSAKDAGYAFASKTLAHKPVAKVLGEYLGLKTIR
ncbi:MAG: glycosyltransferase [Bdellovibrionota bacterium]